MTQQELPTPEDEQDRHILDVYEKVGWAVIGIEAEDYNPAFAFSVGVFRTFEHPEILIMGLKPTAAQAVINHIGEMIQMGKRFGPGRYEGVLEDVPVEFAAVFPQHYREHMGYACWFHGRTDFPALQCVYPDKAGRFPGEPDCTYELYWQQRILGPTTNFPNGWLFPDPPNAASFALKQTFREGKPILLVAHDDDAEDESSGWQFLTGETITTSDAMIVGLSTVVELDPTVNELADLPPGWQAERDAPGAPWRRAPKDDDE
ncbi:MAG: DUF4262 domain-containing protein [Gemmataceae bacterium]